MLITYSAISEAILGVRQHAGPIETANFQCFLKRTQVIPDRPSRRVANIQWRARLGKKERDWINFVRDKRIFGTGDRLGITTITQDERFILVARAQQVKLKAYVIKPYVRLLKR